MIKIAEDYGRYLAGREVIDALIGDHRQRAANDNWRRGPGGDVLIAA